MSLELSQTQDLKLTMQMILSPLMLQQLHILNLPYLELLEEISKAEEENIMLEVERKDEYLEFLKYITGDKKIKKEADFKDYPELKNLTKTEKTLEQHLLDQLEAEELEEPYHSIALHLIENIDNLGYLTDYDKVKVEIKKKFKVEETIVEKTLKIIQSFEPEGVGARNLKECLLIQVAGFGFENKALREVIEKAVSEHLEDLGNKNYKKIAKALNIDEEGVSQIAHFIKNNLNPRPGSSFGEEAKEIIPSFTIEKKKGEFKLINLEKRYGPILKFSPQYLKMLEDPKTDAQTQKFLREKLKSAKELVDNIARRFDTGEKIASIISEAQKEYFDKGLDHIKPLLQRDLANELGVHPSTISRAVAEKYVQTPRGLISLKFLCQRGKAEFSKPKIKAMITDIINKEDKNNSLSDSKITLELQSQGVIINRRTVAVYRQELKIPSFEARLRPSDFGGQGRKNA